MGSLVLPLFAILAAAANIGEPLSPAGRLLIGIYGAFALGMLVIFFHLVRNLEPYLLKESLKQAAFLETISGPFLSIAIVTSTALCLFLELSIIRWQGTIFELFAFYKNYGLLACFVGLGLCYALSRNESGIPLNLTVALFAWQFALLIFLRFGMPGPSFSLATMPFREQLSVGLQMATPGQIVAVYLLLTVVFLLTALAFVPVGQLCRKLMECKSQLSAYRLNLFGSVLGVFLMFLVSFLWTPPVVWFGMCFVTLLFFLERTPKTLLLGMMFTMLATLALAWPVNPLWNRIYSPIRCWISATALKG